MLVHIQDCELDNQAVIQLIKDQTRDSTRREVKFQLDHCGSDIPYRNCWSTSALPSKEAMMRLTCLHNSIAMHKS